MIEKVKTSSVLKLWFETMKNQSCDSALFVCPGALPRDQGVMVRQSFPLHCKGTAGELQDASLSRERARTITSAGAVIRHLRDGSAQVNHMLIYDRL